MSRRDQIQMSEEEQREFLASGHTAILTSISDDGLPHPTAMFYVVVDGLAWFATYARSQKIVNFRRNPAAAVLVEDGKRYEELRGLLIQGRADVRDGDPEMTYRIYRGLYEKYTAGAPIEGDLPEAAEEFVRRASSKRVAVAVVPERVASWDHHKLGGTY